MSNFIDDHFRLNENQFEKAQQQMAHAEITILVAIIAIGVLYVVTHALAPKIGGEIIIDG